MYCGCHSPVELTQHLTYISFFLFIGKTAIAEGVAQILAAPNMLERLDELFDYNDDGEYNKQTDIDRIQQLSSLCPARLRNHRVISLELANLVAGTKYRGEFEERLQSIIEEVTDERAPPTILFIDGKRKESAFVCSFVKKLCYRMIN